MQSETILHVRSSPRGMLSASRRMGDRVVARLARGGGSIIVRDVALGLPTVDGQWIEAAYADPMTRTQAQKQALRLSDELIAEARAASVWIIEAPMWNFGAPASLKAWIDQICRVRETFAYSENGPIGLLKGKRAVVCIASGGVPPESPGDFLTGHVKQVLSFLGIDDVAIFAAARLVFEGETPLERALAEIDAHFPAMAAA